MKKLVALFMSLAFVLCGCAVQVSEKAISSFSVNAGVTFKNFKYECAVVYNGSSVTLSAQSTSAAGLVLAYDGKTVGITYDDISLAQINKNFAPSNPAVALYEAFACVNAMPESEISTIKNGYRAEGETSLGAFTMETDSDFNPVSLVFDSSGLSFEFYWE